MPSSIVTVELVSGALSGVIAYFSARSLRIGRDPHLYALPIGFGFLATSQFLAAYLAAVSVDFQSLQRVRWTQLLSESYAYAFIAFAYFAERRVLAGRYSRVVAWGVPVLMLLIALLTLGLISPTSLSVPSSDIVDEYFSALNLLLLSYVGVKAARSFLKTQTWYRVIFPAGIALLALSQYTLLISRIESGMVLALMSYITRLGGLGLIAGMPLQVFLGKQEL